MDLEKEAIAHFTNPDSMGSLFGEGVRAEWFADEEVAEMYQKSLNYWIESGMKQAVPREVLEHDHASWFSKRGGWPDGEYIPSFIAGRLRTKFQTVQTQDIIREMAVSLSEDPSTAITKGVADLMSVQFRSSSRDRMAVYSEGFGDRIESYLDRAIDNGNTSKGFPLGWPEVTEEMYGLRPEELAILVGYTGIGKSYVCVKMALEAAMNGHRVYFASLENPKEMTLMRLDCVLSGVSYRSYERGQLGPEEFDRLKQAREQVVAIEDRLIVDRPWHRDERTPVELYARAKQFGAELFVGDQLSWLHTEHRYKDQFTRMADIVTEVAELNHETGLASVWAAQFNRQVESNKDRRGRLHQIGMSSTIEQTADFVFSLSQPSDLADREQLILETLKARRSQKKAWILNWSMGDRTDMSVHRETELAGGAR